MPSGGFNALVLEVDVSDLAISLRFWSDLLGFDIASNRREARFAYLARGPIQVMLCERNGNWEVGELSQPFGRGINLQMMVPHGLERPSKRPQTLAPATAVSDGISV